MEINIGKNFGGNIGMRSESLGSEAANVAGMKSEDLDVRKQDIRLTSFSNFDPVKDSEPATDVSDAELRRDDDLGKLVSAAFNLPPPQMPDFGD